MDCCTSLFTVVAKAEDGSVAFNAIRELRPQLAVLDIFLPKMYGLEVARRLRAIRIPTKVGFLTLLTHEEFIDQARHHGHGFVSKLRLHHDLFPAVSAVL